MGSSRLAPLDEGCLEVERRSAPMHVGWAAVLDPPRHGPRPDTERLRGRIASRLERMPRLRQRLEPVPLRLAAPVWVDDPGFELTDHVRPAAGARLPEVASRVLSTPLHPRRPLWELWIADGLEGGRIGLVGKAHHCLLDAIGPLPLASLLVDDTLGGSSTGIHWTPVLPPDKRRSLVEGLAERVRAPLELARDGAWTSTFRRRPSRLVRRTMRATRALGDAVRPATPVDVLNQPISADRHLAMTTRPLDEMRLVRRTFGATVNDVVLAAAAGAIRRQMARRGVSAGLGKVMVPVSLRRPYEAESLGNRTSCMHVELPCDEPDAVRRLELIRARTRERKDAGGAEDSKVAIGLIPGAPQAIRRALARLTSAPGAFNMVISNVPGPLERAEVLGCRVRDVFPAVPLADGHALAIGVFTIGGRACFGACADRRALPDAELLARDVDRELDRLLDRALHSG